MKASEFAARRKRLGVEQREVEVKMRLPSGRPVLPAGSLGAVEDGRIPVTDEFVCELNETLDLIQAERGKRQEAAA